MYKKYTSPLPYLWDVGKLKDILRWPSQQKKKKNFSLFRDRVEVKLASQNV